MPSITTINLKASLATVSGGFVSGAKLRTTLFGFGSMAPSSAGSLITPTTQDWPFTSATITVPLVGNDVISPAGTRYMVQLIDPQGNVVATNEYSFVGSGEQDISVYPPYNEDAGGSAAAGVIVATFALGSPTVFMGPYSAGTTYAVGQAVSFTDGSSYVSLQNGNTGNTPGGAPTWWGLQAKSGAQGPTGPIGLTGDPGTTTATGVNGGFAVPGLIEQQQNVTLSAPNDQLPYVQQIDQTLTVTGSGHNDGNYGGWSALSAFQTTVNNFVRGIKHSWTSFMNNFAEGDTAGFYAYINSVGGPNAPSDESVTGANYEVAEFPSHFRGNISTTSGSGDTQPTFTNIQNQSWIADGAIVMDLSRGSIAGNMTGPGAVVNIDGTIGGSGTPTSYLRAYPVTLTAGGDGNNHLPLTTAWGHIPPNGVVAPPGVTPATLWVLPNTNRNVSTKVPITLTINLYTIGGTYKPFSVGQHVWIAGSNRCEQSTITAIGTVSNNTQSITFPYSYPNSEAYVFQAGLAGQYISFDANEAFSGLYTSHRALGSLDGVNLVYLNNALGGPVTGMPFYGCEATRSDGGASSGFHLYPGAENVANRTGNYQGVLLEPNVVPWAPGDMVVATLPSWFGGHAGWFTKGQSSPTLPSYGSEGFAIEIGGTGVGPANNGLFVNNGSNPAQYMDSGGPMLKPNAKDIGGPWAYGDYYSQAPEVLTYVQNRRTINGTIAAGSTSLTLTSISNLAEGMTIAAPFLAAGTTIQSFAGNVVTISTAATAASANQPVTVPLAILNGHFWQLPDYSFDIGTLRVGYLSLYGGSVNLHGSHFTADADTVVNLGSLNLSGYQGSNVPTMSLGDKSNNIANTNFVANAIANSTTNAFPGGFSVGPSDSDFKTTYFPFNFGSQQGNYFQLKGDNYGGIAMVSGGTPVNIQSYVNGTSPAVGWNFITAPTVPTQAARNNSTLAASTAYVDAAVSGFTGSQQITTPTGTKTLTITNGLITGIA